MIKTFAPPTVASTVQGWTDSPDKRKKAVNNKKSVYEVRRNENCTPDIALKALDCNPRNPLKLRQSVFHCPRTLSGTMII